MTPATFAAIMATLLIGGVALGWVASVFWKRSLDTPPQWRSISYIYGTTIILLCFAVRCLVAGDGAALGDLTICVVGCGLWTIGTHGYHALTDARETDAATAAIPVDFAAPFDPATTTTLPEIGEGDGT